LFPPGLRSLRVRNGRPCTNEISRRRQNIGSCLAPAVRRSRDLGNLVPVDTLTLTCREACNA
jgi:hypothetical protein